MSNAKAAYQRISTILDSREDNPDLPSASAHSPLQGGVEVRNLSFTYPGTEKEILKDISFRAKPGEIIGIMGRTGSGKSTLVTLLSKLYPIPEGKILFDGIDINGYTKSSLREQIGFVAQTSYLFSGTITETIGFSELPGVKIDEEKVKRAASFADIDKDIEEFPLQYSTILGEKGSTVSGGQRQRLSIARAIYKDPKILILDDSLSAVDADTEKEILSNIRNSHKGVTTFLIAERISALEDADKILVLDQGRLVGSGDSKTLLKTCPLFHDIAEMQKLEKEVR
jgi:ATP-binding cassette subfamily B protein